MVRVLVCDQNPARAEDLERRLRILSRGFRVPCEISSIHAEQDLTMRKITHTDLLMMDVAFGSTNGIDLARKIRRLRQNLLLIFLCFSETNCIQYFMEGYEVDAFRFLRGHDLDRKLPNYFRQALEVCTGSKDFILLKSAGDKVAIQPRNLIYVETSDARRQLTLHFDSATRPELSVHATLNFMEKTLEGRSFLRVYRSCLVNMVYIRSLHIARVELFDGRFLPINVRNYNELYDSFMRWRCEPWGSF